MRSSRGPEGLHEHLKLLADTFHREIIIPIRQLDKPVIASIDGVVAGGGSSLALACDLRVASDSARFLIACANIGATADGGSTYLLPRLIGTARAMELYVSNQPIGAQRALDGAIEANPGVPYLQQLAAELSPC